MGFFSPGWGHLITFEPLFSPVGGKFDWKIAKIFKCPTSARPPPPLSSHWYLHKIPKSVLKIYSKLFIVFTIESCLRLQYVKLLRLIIIWLLFALHFRMHYCILAVGFASRLLIDERKNPYHLMLQQFVISGAHKNMFEYVLLHLCSVNFTVTYV